MTDTTKTIPTTFSTDRDAMRRELRCDARIFIVDLVDAPVWHDGDVVATVTGRYPVAVMAGPPTERWYVTLLDNGSLSAIVSWRLPEWLLEVV